MAAAVSGLDDPVPLPSGPGLLPRWLVAVPLMVIATVLPMFGQFTLHAWHTLREFDNEGPAPTFWSELWHDVGHMGGVAVLPGIGLLFFLVWRDTFSAWPKTCFWLAVCVLGPMTLISSAIDAGDTLPNVALAVGLVWLTHGLGRLTSWVLSRPVTFDLVHSALEIPYSVPGSRARLLIRRDYVRLDRLRASATVLGRTIRWAELREARPDELTEPTSWQASPRTSIDVPAGPVLRISGGDEEWLLPVTEAMGEDLAAAITMRARHET